MLRRILPHPLLTGFITIIWMLLLSSMSFGAILVGLVLGLIIPALTGRFWDESPRFRRPAVLLRLVPVVLWDIVVANLSVARITLTQPNRTLEPAFLDIPLEIRDPYAVVALASIITLTPGTVSVQLSEDRRRLVVHALHCPDREGTIADIRARYETPLGELLG